MKASAYFGAESVIETKMGNRVPSDYGFLKPLIDLALKKSDTIGVGCWSDDDISQDPLLTFLTLHEQVEYYCEYTGIINDQITAALIENLLDEQKILRWFSISFYNCNNLVVSIDHHGAEIGTGWLFEDDIQVISEILSNGFFKHITLESEISYTIQTNE